MSATHHLKTFNHVDQVKAGVNITSTSSYHNTPRHRAGVTVKDVGSAVAETSTPFTKAHPVPIFA